MLPFVVGMLVRVLSTGKVGEIYAIRPGRASGALVASVKFDKPGKNRGHGFYYLEELEAADD